MRTFLFLFCSASAAAVTGCATTGSKSCSESEQSVDEVPDKEAGEFADEQEEHGPGGAGLVEAEGYGDDISDEGDPGG